MRSTPTSIPVLLSLLALAAPLSAAELETRAGDTRTSLSANLTQAYLPCLAPNTVSRNGIPACNPPATSMCSTGDATASIRSSVEFLPLVTVNGPRRGPGICQTGQYYLDVGVRTTAEPMESDEVICTSGLCTFQDIVNPVFLNNRPTSFNTVNLLVELQNIDLIRANYEISRIAVIAPDGHPIAAAGLGATTRETFASNLTVPYEPCSTPDPGGAPYACNMVPIYGPCDFESGRIEWRMSDFPRVPLVRLVLNGIVGSSPFCTTGFYRVEATVRATMETCGTAADPEACTLVDTPISVWLEADGEDLDALGLVQVGSGLSAGQYRSLEILSTRVYDPTGALVATPGVNQVEALVEPRVDMSEDQIRVQAGIPVAFDDFAIDPTLDEGFTLTVSDRSGVLFTATIPPERWQLQPPVGARWEYKDKLGVIAGVRKARLRRVIKKDAPPVYQLDLRAKGVPLPSPSFPAVTVAVTVARPAFPGILGPLREQRHRTCTIKGPKLRCR